MDIFLQVKNSLFDMFVGRKYYLKNIDRILSTIESEVKSKNDKVEDIQSLFNLINDLADDSIDLSKTTVRTNNTVDEQPIAISTFHINKMFKVFASLYPNGKIIKLSIKHI